MGDFKGVQDDLRSISGCLKGVSGVYREHQGVSWTFLENSDRIKLVFEGFWDVSERFQGDPGGFTGFEKASVAFRSPRNHLKWLEML